jgi:outer membrane biosynthesis protein TonB
MKSLIRQRVPGKVEIRVYIDEQGNVTDYKLGNDVEMDMDKDALHVAQLYGPEFVPAQNNGANVKSIYTLKVSYKLADYR